MSVAKIMNVIVAVESASNCRIDISMAVCTVYLPKVVVPHVSAAAIGTIAEMM